MPPYEMTGSQSRVRTGSGQGPHQSPDPNFAFMEQNSQLFMWVRRVRNFILCYARKRERIIYYIPIELYGLNWGQTVRTL